MKISYFLILCISFCLILSSYLLAQDNKPNTNKKEISNSQTDEKSNELKKDSITKEELNKILSEFEDKVEKNTSKQIHFAENYITFGTWVVIIFLAIVGVYAFTKIKDAKNDALIAKKAAKDAKELADSGITKEINKRFDDLKKTFDEMQNTADKKKEDVLKDVTNEVSKYTKNQEKISMIYNEGLQNYWSRDYLKAERNFREVLLYDPYHYNAYFYIGKSLNSQKRYLESEVELKKSIELMKDHKADSSVIANAYNELSISHLFQRKFIEAKIDLENAIKFESALIYYTNLGRIFVHLKNFDKVKECLDKVFEINPNDPIALNNLAFAYSKLEKSHEIALELITKSLSRLPAHSFALATKGYILTHLNKHDEAITNLNRAIELNPNNAGFYYDLAIVYAKLKKKTEMIDMLKKCINLEEFYKQEAIEDDDFEKYRDDDDFKEIVE